MRKDLFKLSQEYSSLRSFGKHSMTYFIYEGNITVNAQFQFTGEEVSHILSSRRIKKGEIIDIQDNLNKRYAVVVDQIVRKKIFMTAVRELVVPPESKLKIQIFQSAIKEKAMDNIIQKLTELGCWKLYIFQSEFSQKLHQGDQLQKKLDRWQKISISACKQSDRMEAIKIEVLHSFSAVLEYIKNEKSEIAETFFLDSGHSEKIDFQSLASKSQINLIIGPEGGWHPNEIEENIFGIFKLGPRILRADTAAISATAIFQHIMGDLN